MPYVKNSDVRIHYHVEGAGPDLILQHGLTNSMENWYAYGFVEELKKNYRLILVDARGHGKSDKPHDPSLYDLKLRVGDIIAVMDALGVDKAHYMGYSMGGRIGFGLIMYELDRFNSLIIGGMSADTPNTDIPPEERIKTLKLGMESYVADAEEKEGPIETLRRERLLDNDAEALIAATIAPRGTDGVEQLLHDVDIPCLLYCGDQDGYFEAAQKSAGLIPTAIFVDIPGLNHGQVARAGEEVLPHVTRFLENVIP